MEILWTEYRLFLWHMCCGFMFWQPTWQFSRELKSTHTIYHFFLRVLRQIYSNLDMLSLKIVSMPRRSCFFFFNFIFSTFFPSPKRRLFETLKKFIQILKTKTGLGPGIENKCSWVTYSNLSQCSTQLCEKKSYIVNHLEKAKVDY